MTEFIRQFQGQGSIYWVAAASIATGATLLLVSGLVLAKRGLVRGLLAAWRPRRGIGGRKQRGRTVSNRVELTETGYTAEVPVTGIAGNAGAVPDGQDLLDLQRRLKQAANALEEIHLALKDQDQLQPGSGLKAPLGDVEYLFKTGIA